MAVDKRAVRLGALALVSVVLLGAVGVRLWFLQTVQRASLQAEVQSSSTRTQFLVGERGRIFDSLGRIVADNRRVLTVTIDRSIIRKEKNRTTLFTRLSGILNVPVETMEARWKSGQYSNYLPLPVADDVAEDVVLQIESRSEDFPGVRGDEDWARVYPYAPLASHVIGYLGLILKSQAVDYKAQGYLSNETVGQFGVEKNMESVLHGTWGKVVYEVDSANHVIREVSRIDPVPGKDVQLTIDMKVQQFAERLLESELRARRQTADPSLMAKNPKDKDGKYKFVGENWYVDSTGQQYLPYPAPAGSLVVQDHESGQIVAMASYPTFDNRWFTIGLTGAKFKQLFPTPEPTDPNRADKSILVNRAIQGQYNLGSTFKPFVAYSAVMAGVITPQEVYNDTGSYKLNIDTSKCNAGVRCEYFNALNPQGSPSKYGPVRLEDALAVSSDAYFYRLGEKTFEKGRTLLGDELKSFGFGSKTGIDLPFEFAGRIPTSELKKQLIERHVLRVDEVPTLLVGDNVQLAIGQGLFAASPLQLANAYSTLANGGFLNRPHVVKAIYQGGVPDGYPGSANLAKGTLMTSYEKPELIQQIDLPADVGLPIIQGLIRVIRGRGVTDPTGFLHSTTGEQLFKSYPYNDLKIAGKTGTAQGAASKPWYDSSVFAGVSLDNAKPYTVVAYLEKSGYGSQAAGPAVKCMFQALGGSVTMDEVTISDPLDQSSSVAAPSNVLPDASCLQNAYTPIRD